MSFSPTMVIVFMTSLFLDLESPKCWRLKAHTRKSEAPWTSLSPVRKERRRREMDFMAHSCKRQSPLRWTHGNMNSIEKPSNFFFCCSCFKPMKPATLSPCGPTKRANRWSKTQFVWLCLCLSSVLCLSFLFSDWEELSVLLKQPLSSQTSTGCNQIESVNSFPFWGSATSHSKYSHHISLESTSNGYALDRRF